MAEKQDKKQKKPGEGGGKMQKQPRKPKGAAAEVVVEDESSEPQAPPPPPRLWGKYREQVVPALTQQFGYKNRLAVPRLEKIVVSMGLGRFATEGGEGKGKFERAEKELTVIAGQKPVRCRAKKSVANFKVREGQDTGLKVTLRGARMYEFLDRLISIGFPRVKDFRGVNPNGFDRHGNFNFGFTEQTVFPEVDAANITFQQGMNITVVTTARKQDEGRELLKQFGFPFRTEEKEGK
jgi:large subunit ribosomal protein L5